MLLSRILGAIGRFCIGLGVVTLLFVTYQLWGTGILTAQAQGALEDDFEALLEQASSGIDQELLDLAAQAEPTATPDPGPTTAPDPDEPEPPAPTPTPTPDPADIAAERLAEETMRLLSELLWQPPGEPVAQLSIPDINLEWTVVAGVGVDELRKGPGHYPSTPLPGMAGNAALAGHRTTWGAPFNRIDELQPGAIITVRTIQGTFEYRVIPQESGKGHFIVTPDRVDVLDQENQDAPNRLTLTSCHPKFSARQRIIVVAELVGEPAITVPRPGGQEAPEATLASEEFDDAGGTDGAGAGSADDGDGDTTDDGGLPGDPDLDDGGDDDAAADAGDDEVDDPVVESNAGSGGEGEGNGGDQGGDEVVGAAPVESPPTQTASFQGTPEADSFGEGLNGDQSAVLPAILWGLAATSIAGVAGFTARRWRKWPSYVLATVPFAIVLFVCFVYIDQALPSY